MIRNLALAAVLATAGFASAATFTAVPVFVQALDAAFNPIAGYDLASGQAATLEFGIDVSISNLAAGELGLANIFSTVSTTGPISDPGFGYAPATAPNVDTNGSAPGGSLPLWADNADFGAADLRDIAFGVATPLATNSAVDPRWRAGQAAPVRVGGFFLNYAGGGLASVSLTPTQGSVLRNGGIGEAVFAPQSAFVGGSVSVGRENNPDPTVPEPSTAILAGLALAGFAARRNG